jgi:lipase chaperone LimK
MAGWLGLAGAVVSLAAWLCVQLAARAPSPTGETAATPPASVAEVPPRLVRAASPAPAREPAPAEPPRSLRGTEIDGQLELGTDGHFQASSAARRLFDYFLSTTGEEDSAAIRRRVENAARSQLPGGEVERALSLYDRYVDYRVQLAAALQSVAVPNAREGLALVEQAQVAAFGQDDAARLFGADNAVAELTVERAELLQRTDISDDERAARLAQLEERLPEDLRRARARRLALSSAAMLTP